MLEILNNLPLQSSPLVSAMKYTTLLSAKRLRPSLVYATGIMLGVNIDSLDAPAAAIEFIHTYSLIHDDLPAMDNSTLRRGSETAHIRFGEDYAILAGDALQALAFSTISSKVTPDVSNKIRVKMISEIANASGVSGICGGQALDLKADPEKLEKIHIYKTGSLIRSAIKLGLIVSECDDLSVARSLDYYASTIGLALQIQDDILDIVGNTSVVGKNRGADKYLGKITYPELLGLDGAKARAQELYQESLEAIADLEMKSFKTVTLRQLASFIVKRNR
jgi:farnesyl diphosphate synthase